MSEKDIERTRKAVAQAINDLRKIKDTADRLTSGNVAHHGANISQTAEYRITKLEKIHDELLLPRKKP